MTAFTWFALVFVVACGGKMPETRYYQLAVPAAGGARAAGALDIAIEPLAAEPAYDDERIVYRSSPYRLDYYQYHRWSAPPGTLVAGFLEQSLERSGSFRAVVRDAGGAAPIVLGGRVIAIEEVDTTRQRWVGRIVVELVVTDSRTNTTLWSQQFEETEPVARQTPEGLAHALSAAMARIAARATPEIAAIVQHQAGLPATARNP